LWDELERPTVVPLPPHDPLGHEVREVLVNGRRRREAELRADLFERRRIAVLAGVVVEVVDDLLLALGEGGN